MSLIVQTLIIGLIASVVYFVFSPVVAGWLVYGGYLFYAIGLFIHGLFVRKDMQQGKTVDWTAAVMLPPAMAILILILIAYLFTGFNKLHLLWIAPLVTFIVEQIAGRKIYKGLREQEKKIMEGAKIHAKEIK